MQFLVITKPSSAPPFEMLSPLMDGMNAWLAHWRSAGKLKESWAFAGLGGGGGIAEVASHEELEEIMVGFPWAPWSSIEIYALSDLDHSLAANRAALAQMTGGSA
jgi:muconolactone delta-isomerase